MTSESDQPIWKSSPILVVLEWVFRRLEKMSFATRWFKTRDEVNQMDEGAAHVARTRNRMRQIDFYVLAWALIETALIMATAMATSSWVRVPAACVAGFRVLEILQSIVNVAIFAGLRGHRNRLASAQRIVVLAVINFLELIACFGLLYVASVSSLQGLRSWYDPYVLSVGMQTTGGAGVVQPTNWLNAVTGLQSLVGVLVGVVVLAQFVAILPQLQDEERSQHSDS